MLPSMLSLPMNSRLFVGSVGFVAHGVSPGAAKPVSLASFSGDKLTPTKAVGLCVLSAELARMSLASNFINTELRAAVSSATDSVFLTAMIAASTPTASAGSTAAQTLTDFGVLLGGITLSSGSRPYLVYSPSALKGLLGKQLASGGRAWPDLRWPSVGSNAGEMSGIPTLMSDQLPANTALAIDSAQVVANGGEVELDSSSEADILMSDAPAMASLGGSPSAPTAANVINLFQTNSLAVKCERTFAYHLARSSAVKSLSGVNY
jgi:hypothetical protein